MSEKSQKTQKKNWFKGLNAEFKKIIWPDKQTLVKETAAVVSVSVVLGAIIALVDFLAQHGIDILVNNAVSREFADELEELDRTSVMASMEVNIAGQISMVQAVLPYMKRRGGGSILFLSSVNALTAPKFSLMTEHRKSPANYTMEKWGINGLTKWLAARYGKDNIRVNSLCPGTFDPDMFKQSENAAYIRNVMEYRPISRFMCAEEVAGPALFLVSDAASYCTGVLLAVDGGYSL